MSAGEPAWRIHLPAGLRPSDVDLAAGGSLPGAFMRAWAAAPDHTVLSTLDGVRMSAAELEERTGAAAKRYAAAGLSSGDRVLLCATASVDMVIAYVGALRAGVTVVPANPGYPPAELATLVDACAPALAVLDDPGVLSTPSFPVTPPTLESLPRRGLDLVLDAAAPEDTALVIYTSGTTGRPKGAPLSHANLLASAHAVRIAWRWTPDDTLALCLPLFHMHGLGVGLHGSLVTGATATLHPFSPESVASAVEAGASMFFGVPTMYHRIAASPHLGALSGLRLAVSGSAPLPADLHEAVRAGSGQAVLERYGMAETAMLAYNPYDGERRRGTVGFPLPGVELRLAPHEGGVSASARSELASPAGRSQRAMEIEVAGPNVIDGYLDNPEATAASFTVDGWFRTGDLGTLDEDGYLSISGRAKELIITGGYNVYPREVEELLRTHPGVADAAVVGVPSRKWGETVAAFVVPDRTASSASWRAEHSGSASEQLTAALAAWCEEHLVSYKRPREWHVVEAIPRNALGKIQRHLLME